VNSHPDSLGINDYYFENLTNMDCIVEDVFFQCVQESLMMIPDCHRRLEKAYNDLKALVIRPIL